MAAGSNDEGSVIGVEKVRNAEYGVNERDNMSEAVQWWPVKGCRLENSKGCAVCMSEGKE